MKISNTDSSPYNVEDDENNTVKINDSAKDRIIKFINLLSSLTKWDYKEENWTWEGFKLYQFKKRDFKADDLNLTNTNYDAFINKNGLLSWAMTNGQNIEYTLEEPDKLF